MITFIVTTYNLAPWLLRRCLESIVSQDLSRESYEIIVVDDESEVSPQAVVDEYADRAPIALYTQRHSRQGAARNLALEHAKGEWIQFVDGDDYLLPGTIAPVLKAAEKNGLDLLSYGFREVGDQPDDNCQAATLSFGCKSSSKIDSRSLARTLPTIHCQLVGSGDDYMLHHNLFGSCCTLLFRRTLCTDENYGEPLRFTEHIYIEDEEFITKLMFRAQRVATTPMVVYAYYQRPGSTVNSRSREHTDELFRNYFVVLNRLQQFESTLTTMAHDGLTRKIRTLAIDILRRSLREENWQERWDETVSQLRTLGLYPIPAGRYSWKFRAFSLLSTCRLGQRILRINEPH